MPDTNREEVLRGHPRTLEMTGFNTDEFIVDSEVRRKGQPDYGNGGVQHSSRSMSQDFCK